MGIGKFHLGIWLNQMRQAGSIMLMKTDILETPSFFFIIEKILNYAIKIIERENSWQAIEYNKIQILLKTMYNKLLNFTERR